MHWASDHSNSCELLLDLPILDEPSALAMYMPLHDLDLNSLAARGGQLHVSLCLWGWPEEKPSGLAMYMTPHDLDLHCWGAKGGQLDSSLCLWGWPNEPQERETYLKSTHPSSFGG